MNDTPTPRTEETFTDKVMDVFYTELTAAQEELAEWSILKGWGGTPEIINDFIKGQQTRIHHAQNIEEELTAVTEQRDEWGNLWADLSRACVKDLTKVEREVVTLTEQRDRLAEALKRIANNNVHDTPQTDYAYVLGRMEGIAKIALQSLKQPTP